MKTITTTGILFLFLFACMSATPIKKPTRILQTKRSTTSSSFAFFRTHRQGRGITATWGLTSNTGVSGFIVRKTDQAPADALPEDWWVIYSTPNNASRSFKFTDNDVRGGYFSYQVEAIMTDGSSIFSEILTERLVSH